MTALRRRNEDHVTKTTIDIKREPEGPTLSISVEAEDTDAGDKLYIAEASLRVGGLASPFGTTARRDSKRGAAEEAIAFVLGRALLYVRDEDLAELRSLAKLADRAIESMPRDIGKRWSVDF